MAEFLKCEHPIESQQYCYIDYEIGRRYSIQCQLCGEKTTKTWISKKNIPDINSVKPYNKELRASFLERSRLHRRKEYIEYLDSPQWQEKRKEVITRSNNICERCGKAKVQEVHHLTYKRLGNELLSDLLGVCKRCHNILDAERMPDM